MTWGLLVTAVVEGDSGFNVIIGKVGSSDFSGIRRCSAGVFGCVSVSPNGCSGAAADFVSIAVAVTAIGSGHSSSTTVSSASDGAGTKISQPTNTINPLMQVRPSNSTGTIDAGRE